MNFGVVRRRRSRWACSANSTRPQSPVVASMSEHSEAIAGGPTAKAASLSTGFVQACEGCARTEYPASNLRVSYRGVGRPSLLLLEAYGRCTRKQRPRDIVRNIARPREYRGIDPFFGSMERQINLPVRL